MRIHTNVSVRSRRSWKEPWYVSILLWAWGKNEILTWNGGISIFRFLPGMRSPSRSSVQNGCVCIGNDCLGFFFLHEYLGVFSTHRKSLEILESVARFNLGSDFERYIYCSWLFLKYLKSSPICSAAALEYREAGRKHRQHKIKHTVGKLVLELGGRDSSTTGNIRAIVH